MKAGLLRTIATLGFVCTTALGAANVPLDQVQAAAEKGDASAQCDLARAYLNGEGIGPDPVKAFEWYKKSAEQGLPKAEHNLANLYISGRGVKEDATAAVQWYRKAAESGLALSQVNLGVLLADGTGTPKDVVQAVKWFKAAAAQGNVAAQARLARLYSTGDGIEKNEPESLKWASMAVDNGNFSVMNIIGQYYENGTAGVVADARVAADWYRKAAVKGDAEAQGNLGRLYMDGRGVPRDLVKAYEWLSLAAAHENLLAKKMLANVQPALSDAQKAEVEKWKGEKLKPLGGSFLAE